MNVALDGVFFFVVANDSVEGFGLPEALVCFCEDTVCFTGDAPFPRLEDSRQGVTVDRPNQGVDVVRHDHPDVEFVAFVVEEGECFTGDGGDLRVHGRI